LGPLNFILDVISEFPPIYLYPSQQTSTLLARFQINPPDFLRSVLGGRHSLLVCLGFVDRLIQVQAIEVLGDL